MSQINKYIKNIKEKKPINYGVFKKICLQFNIGDIILREIFTINFIKEDRYNIIIKNDELFNSTFKRFLAKNENIKTQAALQGNSKTEKSPFSLLTIKNNYSDKNGFFIHFEKEEFEIPAYLCKTEKLLIIENINTFCDTKLLFLGDIFKEKVNIILGEGLKITNKNYSKFLNTYNEIICAFDFDFGGFKTFKILKNNLNQNIKFSFFINEYMKDKIIGFGNQISNEKIFELNDYKNIEELKDIILFIQETKKFAEQEIFQDF